MRHNIWKRVDRSLIKVFYDGEGVLWSNVLYFPHHRSSGPWSSTAIINRPSIVFFSRCLPAWIHLFLSCIVFTFCTTEATAQPFIRTTIIHRQSICLLEGIFLCAFVYFWRTQFSWIVPQALYHASQGSDHTHITNIYTRNRTTSAMVRLFTHHKK